MRTVERRKIVAAAELDTWLIQGCVFGVTITGGTPLNGATEFGLEVLPGSETDEVVIQRQLIADDPPKVYIRVFDDKTDTWGSWKKTVEEASYEDMVLSGTVTMTDLEPATGTELLTVGADGAVASVALAGTGEASTPARSDHNHEEYALKGAVAITYTVTASGAIAVGGLCMQDGTTGKWKACDATAPGYGAHVLAYALEEAEKADDEIAVLLVGIVPVEGATPGATAYVSDTGAIAFTPVEDHVRVLGYVLSSTELFFHPEADVRPTIEG